jgi:hypothetical protein
MVVSVSSTKDERDIVNEFPGSGLLETFAEEFPTYQEDPTR